MLWRKRKSDEDYEEKSKASGIFKVSIVIFILVFVLLLIPEEWFEEKVEEIEQRDSATEDSGREEQEVLEIVGQSPDGAIRFDTIFGGTDYQAEYNAFWSENTLEGHESLEEYLSATDLDTIFSEVPTGSSQTEGSLIADVLPENPFSLSMLKSADYIRFSTMVERVCIGVVQNYYAISWIKGTDFIFVDDYSERYFDDYYFTRQMLHFGKVVADGFSTDSVKVEEFDRFTIIYIGGNR